MRPRLLAASLLVLASAASAAASDVPVNAILFPEKRSVDVPFAPTALAPQAGAEASVKLDSGQARIDLDYKNLAPALAFGGDVSCYVLWALTPGGAAENLGELVVTEGSGSGRFQTGQKEFGMLVTAEPYPQVTRPSTLIVFASMATKDKHSRNSTFAYSRAVPATRHDAASVGAAWTGSEPVAVAQARRIYDTAQQMGVAPSALQEAGVALGQAANFGKAGDEKMMTDYARRSVAASGAAIQATQAANAAKATADAASQQQAQMQALQQQAAASQKQATETAAAAAEAKSVAEEAQQARAEAAALAAKNQAERDTIAAERDSLQKERDAMAANLVAALSKIADTKHTPRGIVVTLPGSYFGPNNELTAAAKSAVSRLASTALLSPDNNLRIEGYCDAGPDEADNLAFSQTRAKAVYDYLLSDGTPAERMTSEGYGSQYPVASNVSEEGRALNRRVEVIVARGVVMDARTFAESQGKN